MIRYQAQPGKGAVVRRKASALVATVVAEEPACFGIRLYQDADDDTRFLLYERWKDKATYVGPHMQTPHLQTFREEAQELLTGPPEITFWRLVREERPR